MLWSIATIVKLSALLFAWMYVVEAIKYEIATLEASKVGAGPRITHACVLWYKTSYLCRP